MQFGQLQIFRPDGPGETFILVGETVGIGRSPGNDLPLDRNGVSRYHVTFTIKDNQVFITDLDSVNGTYIDGLPLKGSEPRLLSGGEEIQIADVRIVFQPMVDLDVTVQNKTQTLELEDVIIEMDGPSMAVTPGAYVHSEMTITNLKQQETTFGVEVDGVPKNWVRVDHREIALDPNEKRQLRFNFKPRRHSESTPGEYKVVVKVFEVDNPEITYNVETILHVQKFSGFGVALAQERISNDKPFNLYIHNQGNGPLPLEIFGRSPNVPMTFKLSPTQVTLNAGERQTVQCQITSVSQQLLGKEEAQRFDIVCRSLDAAGFQAPLSGYYLTKPTVPSWGLPAAIAGLGAVVIILFALSLMFFGGDDSDNSSNNDTRQPVNTVAVNINNFGVIASRTTVENPLLVNWSTSNSELVLLVLRHETLSETVYALPDVVGNGYEVPINIAGRYDLVLQAQNGDAMQESDPITVFVEPKIDLTIGFVGDQTSDVSNLVLYRNVEHELEISWSVTWTVDPETDGRAAPTVVLDSPTLGYDEQLVPIFSAPQTITRRPTEIGAFEISLLTDGPDDIQRNFVLEVPVVDPVCALTAPVTDIFMGPDEVNFPLLSTIQPQPIRVDTRTADGTWFRIYIPPMTNNVVAEFGWIKNEALDCQFEVDALKVIDVLPTPPPRFGSNGTPENSNNNTGTSATSSQPVQPTPTFTPPPQQG